MQDNRLKVRIELIISPEFVSVLSRSGEFDHRAGFVCGLIFAMPRHA